MRYHLSAPPTGVGPAVLVLHEAWGLTPDIIWAADRLAGYGYVALAPDLDEMMGGPVRAVAQLLAGRGPLIDGAASALGVLADRPEVDSGRMGVVGFSMGAALALTLDGRPGVSVLGLNYGMVPPRLPPPTTPVVASYGDRDRLLPRAGVSLGRRLASSSVARDIEVYPGVGHSFMTPVDPSRRALARKVLGIVHDDEVSDHAWLRMREFFGLHLPVGRDCGAGVGQ